MIKILVKADERTPRFRTLRTFADRDTDAAFAFAAEQERVCWAVQVKSNGTPSGGWYELRTRYNTRPEGAAS